MHEAKDPYNYLARSDQIMEAQRLENERLLRYHEKGKVGAITLRTAIDESAAAFAWLMEVFFYSPRKSMETIMEDGKKDSLHRLRGIGFLLISLSGALLLVEGILGNS
jgi:uncharacterized protein YuzE